METVNIKDFKKEEKKRKFKEAAGKKISQAAKWVEEHKEAIIIATPIVTAGISGLSSLTKNINRHNSQNREKELKELYCYDRSLGHYWKLNKPLTNAEWTKINERKKNGESLADILASMRVLK